jgi:hypothetical protein
MTMNFSKIRNRIKTKILDISFSALLWFIRKLTSAWSTGVIKTSMHCRVACFVEAWAQAAEGKPVDAESTLFKEISEVIEYYLSRPPKGAASPGIFEQIVLAHIYLRRPQHEEDLSAKKRYHRFVHRLKIAKIIREFYNIQFLINLRATEQFASLQTILYKETPSVPYWKEKVAQNRLPDKLRGNPQLGRINSYLKKRIKAGKLRIARSNYPKLDFSFSDLGAFIAVSGTLLLLLGYLHVFIVNTYFGVPYQRYFQASDYIASSANGFTGVFLGAVLGAGFGFFYWSSVNSYSTQSASIVARSFSSRLNDWVIHFVGIGALLALGTVFYNDHRIDSLSFLGASLYIGGQLIGRFCSLYFANPLRALFIVTLVYVAVVNTIADAFHEIEKVTRLKSGPSTRTLQFVDRSYSEPEWYVLAITSGFVIMRHQLDGAIRVLRKADLKQVDSVPSASMD